MLRVDFEEHHVLRIVIAQDGAAKFGVEGRVQREVQIIRVTIGPLQKRLIRVERRERLNLHQFRLQRIRSTRNQPE